MNMAVGVVMLLHTGVDIGIDARVDARVDWRVQHRRVPGSSLHCSKNTGVRHRVAAVIVVMLRHLMVVLRHLVVGVELLRLVLEVLEWVSLEVLMIKNVWLVPNSGGCSSSGGGGGGCALVPVQGLFHQRSGVLSSLLLASDNGEVRLRRVIVSWVDHSQNPHLRFLLVIVVAVKVVGVFLDLLSLVLLRWIQVGNQPVSTLGSLGVSHSLSLASILNGCSERARSFALEIHSLGL